MNKDPIYQAQCFGNVEPIEYMVPYPNLRSLAEGQCIKFADNILFKENQITNSDFLKAVNQYANWLSLDGIKKGDIIIVDNIPSPEFDILSYAIWSLGAILSISDGSTSDKNPKMIIDSKSNLVKSKIDNQSTEFAPISNILLNDAAVLFYHNNKGLQLSHYNLLVNTSGILKELNILYNDSLNIDIPISTTAYIVLNTVLPLYSGTTITNENAKITFGMNNEADYLVQFNWDKLQNTTPQSLYVLPEVTAVLAIGDKPTHLLSIDQDEQSYKINGHSVMIGYTDEEHNSQVFKDGSLIISK